MSRDRKEDHIELAFKSQSSETGLLSDSFYEPLLSGHPDSRSLIKEFLGFEFGMPLWISSMTGGTEKAFRINQNLARACAEFKIGMGLGSCRPLLESDERFIDFDLRKLMKDAPLYTNFGIAQLEHLIAENNLSRIFEISKRLEANGIIIHVNPLQEWAQKEGDRFNNPPLETIKYVLDKSPYPVIVKEVGQGMGPKSLKLLSELPLQAIELAGFGGTNFTTLELTRRNGALSGKKGPSQYTAQIGHTAKEMINWLNAFDTTKPDIIISGGIHNPLIGHELMLQYKGNAIVGMASEILKHALDDYESLEIYLTELKETFAIAKAFIQR